MPESAGLEVGRALGIEQTSLVRANLVWGWGRQPDRHRTPPLRAYWELSVGTWDGDREILDAAATALLRWQPAGGRLASPYLEGAFGVHVITGVHMHDRCFSTGFQFGEHVGLGAHFGRQRKFDLSYRLQHVSNGGIAVPNSGLTSTSSGSASPSDRLSGTPFPLAGGAHRTVIVYHLGPPIN
jgi:hypothetical protein